jgi:hypothetical protein
LGEVSPVVQTLAQRQFDDYVKRVRIFAHPNLIAEIERIGDLSDALGEAIARMESG